MFLLIGPKDDIVSWSQSLKLVPAPSDFGTLICFQGFSSFLVEEAFTHIRCIMHK